jgi:hypothetical protein
MSAKPTGGEKGKAKASAVLKIPICEGIKTFKYNKGCKSKWK